MSVTFRIDKSLQTVFTTAAGVVTLQDLLDCIRGLLEDPDFHPNLNRLIDLRAVTELKITSVEVHTTTSENPERIGEKARRAVVLPDQPAVWGILKMYKILLGLEHQSIQKNFQIFGDMEAAKKWLGLSDVSG